MFFELMAPLLLALFIAYMYSWNESKKDKMDKYEPVNIMTTSPPTTTTLNPRFKGVPPKIFNDDDFPLIELNLKRVPYPRPQILYGPSNNLTDRLMEGIKNTYKDPKLNNTELFVVKGMSAEMVSTEMQVLVATLTSEPAMYQKEHLMRSKVGVIFDTSALEENRLKYTIRSIGKDMDINVNRLFHQKTILEPAKEPQDYKGFCLIQVLINNEFVKNFQKNKEQTYRVKSIKTMRYPFPPYTEPKEKFTLFSIRDFIASAIIIGYVVLCPLIVKRITDEKANKAKELLKMIGMSDWVFWSSHFLSYLIIMVFHAFMFTLIYCIGWNGYPIVKYSSESLLFTIIVIYSIQSILFCMALTTVFNRPVLAVVITVIIWILSYAIPFGLLSPVFHENMDIVGTNKYRILSSFLPNMGLTWALALVGQMEIMGTGAQWSSLFKHTITYKSFTLVRVLIAMSLSCLIYCILIWYIDNVWPFQYGVPKPIFFPFSKSYWCPPKHSSLKRKSDSSEPDLVTDAENFEREPDGRVAIMIKNLRKVFGGYGYYRKTAVRNLSLNIYEKQITVLLGHNGAGKTTTMNMITGIYPPTSGTILVNGFDVQYETSSARKSIGLCPQVCPQINSILL